MKYTRRPYAALPRLGTGLVASALLAASAGAQTQWVVDAAGGGDFTSLSEAFEQVEAGDILLILPGDYDAGVLGKRMHLVGKPDGPRPFIQGLDIAAASAFTLSHLEIRRLRVVDVNSRSVIDGCLIGPGPHWGGVQDFGNVIVRDAGDVLVSRSELRGFYSVADGTAALRVQQGSRVQIVSSHLRGGTAPAVPSYGAGYGGDGLSVEGESSVWIADSSLEGGDGEHLWFPSDYGLGGHGISLDSNSHVDLRGTDANLIAGGVSDPLHSHLGSPGAAVACGDASSGALWSGVSFQGNLGACLEAHSEFAPFLVPTGQDGPALVRGVELYGTAGQTAFLFNGFVPTVLELPFFLTTPLWIAPGALFELIPLTLAGTDTPVALTWQQPASPAFAGLRLHLQAAQVIPSGEFLGTNAAAFVLSW